MHLGSFSPMALAFAIVTLGLGGCGNSPAGDDGNAEGESGGSSNKAGSAGTTVNGDKAGNDEQAGDGKGGEGGNKTSGGGNGGTTKGGGGALKGSGGATAKGGSTGAGGRTVNKGGSGPGDGGAGRGGSAKTDGGPGEGGSGTGGSSQSDGGGGNNTESAEDPSADCTVGAMPSVSSLTASDKLPDPFKTMAGTAMTTKKEWRCRREEILQMGYEFIYGKKPRTPATAVSGTVSSSKIEVSVKDGGSASFSATVSVPSGGKAPYPAVITLSSAAAATEMQKLGVAVINYDPYSVGSEQTAGTGAFYSVYGKDNEAGLLTAWAWGVSRIIDVIEKNPGTIDPTKIAVTGCSRFGKGAFVSGVMDARIALTVPEESGIGGTPALRLIEQLDSYSGSEWPYHGISYEPWFSPKKLGQFTTGNSASADNTNKLPVDTHEMMALIVPRGLYIVDNPSTDYNGLDRNSAYVTAMIGQKIFEALGAKDSFTYQGASGSHCQWRTQYSAPLQAVTKKFLLGDTSAATGTFATDIGSKPSNPDSYMGFTVPNLSGEL
jgi:hypothetical protein